MSKVDGTFDLDEAGDAVKAWPVSITIREDDIIT